VKLSDSASSLLSQHSLRLAGLLNLVGDVAMLAEGLGVGGVQQEIQPFKVATGALYTLGGANLVLFGSPDANRATHELSHRIADFIQRETGELPAASQLAHICAAPHSALEQCKNALAKEPVQNTMALYTLGAATALADGVSKYNSSDDAHKDWKKLGYGASSLSLKLATYLIPETNAKEPEEHPTGIIGWMKQKPLRLFGYGSFIADGFMINDTIQDIKDKPDLTDMQKGIMITKSASYMIADLLMAISHKSSENNVAVLNDAQQTEIMQLVDDAIANHSITDKAALRSQIEQFLEEQPELQTPSWVQRVSGTHAETGQSLGR
jgi:hypothetical protein